METKYSSFPPYYEKYLCTMGQMKTSRFPHSTEFRYKKKTCTFITLKNLQFRLRPGDRLK